MTIDSTEPTAMERLLGATLWSRSGSASTREVMEGKRVVGLFFTTSGCRRCQLFSPILETVYRNMTLNMYRHLSMQDEMEVVMVTMDAKVSTFREYLLRVPFKALPLYRRDLAHRLIERYQVTRMPSLVFIDANGEAINFNGRELLEENFTNLDRVWTPLRDQKLAASAS